MKIVMFGRNLFPAITEQKRLSHEYSAGYSSDVLTLLCEITLHHTPEDSNLSL
jgi:hypothetical protein